MSEVFYRKFRPQSFSQVIGQSHVTSVLSQAVLNNKLSHAYLFSGPRGTGKTSTARLLAKAINCQNFSRGQDLCGECYVCKSLEGTDLSCIEIDAASNRGINEIRQLRESISYASGNGYKTYIIDEVHMLTTEAFNALLKTLEEPPAHVIFILATTELHKVPQTILSRVQHFQFRLGSKEHVIQKLKHVIDSEGYEVDGIVLEMLFELADGGYRDAESLLGKLISSLNNSNKKITEQDAYTILGLPSKQEVSTLISYLLNGDLLLSLNQINKLDTEGVNWQYFIRALLNSLKERILSALENAEPTNQLSELLRLVSAVYSQLKDFPSPKLALETEIILKINTQSVDKVDKKVSTSTKVQSEDKANPEQKHAKTPVQIVETLLNELPQKAPVVVEQQPELAPEAPKSDLALDLEKFVKLLKPKLALYPVLKQIKIDWQDAKLLMYSESSAQTSILKANLSVIKQTIKSLVGKECEVEIVLSKEEQKVSQQKAIKQASIREEQTNAKLVEELF